MFFVIRALVMVIGTVICLFLVLQIFKSMRRLNTRIAEIKAEEEARGGAPIDPYAALAELYAEDARKELEAKRKRGR